MSEIALKLPPPAQEMLEKSVMKFGCRNYEEFVVMSMNVMDSLRNAQEEGHVVFVARNPKNSKEIRITMPFIKY